MKVKIWFKDGNIETLNCHHVEKQHFLNDTLTYIIPVDYDGATMGYYYWESVIKYKEYEKEDE